MTTPDRYALYRDGVMVKAFPTKWQCRIEARERGWVIAVGPTYFLQPGTEIRPIEETKT